MSWKLALMLWGLWWLLLCVVAESATPSVPEPAICTFEWEPPPRPTDGTPQVRLEGYQLWRAGSLDGPWTLVATVADPTRQIALECVSGSYWRTYVYFTQDKGTAREVVVTLPASNTLRLSLDATGKQILTEEPQ